MSTTKNTKRHEDTGAIVVPLLPYQRRAVESTAQFTWNNWSRQTGKSFAFALRRLVRGMSRNRNQILLSAGERQSRELMAKVRTHLSAIRSAVDATIDDIPDSVFEGTTFGKLETRVRHRSGAFDFRVIALPANPLTARGYTGDLFLDEFAMHRDDAEIWSAIYPVAMRGKGEIDICSTPKGRKNMFYRLRGNPVFTQSTVTIEDAIADGLDVDTALLREGMADDDAYEQEFMCQFLDEATAFLTFEQIAACEDLQLDKTWDGAKAFDCIGEDLYVGVDVGRHRDLTVIWVWGKPKGSSTLLTRGVIELSKTQFRFQEETINSLMCLPNCKRLCIDATGMGEQMAEELAERWGADRAEPVKFTMESKNEMACALRVKVEDCTARIPADADIRNDWHSIEKIVMPGGSIRYRAERGHGGTEGHADRFWAAALGVRAASLQSVPFEYQPAGRCVGARRGIW
jgi:phage FluMu gp28-like protein